MRIVKAYQTITVRNGEIQSYSPQICLNEAVLKQAMQHTIESWENIGYVASPYKGKAYQYVTDESGQPAVVKLTTTLEMTDGVNTIRLHIGHRAFQAID